MFTRIRTATATGLVLLVSSPVLAADLVPAPPPVETYVEPAPVWTWSGLYVGGHVGYTSFSQDATATANTGVFSAGETAAGDEDAFLGGLQVGYDHQWGFWVLGGAFDYSWTGIDGGSTFSGGGARFESDVNSVFTLTARLGREITPGTLAYVKGGAAWQDVDYSVPGSGLGSDDDIRSGWTVGGGLEQRIADNWSVNAEYNYLDFGGDDFASAVDVDSDAHLFKIGLNYRFGALGY